MGFPKTGLEIARKPLLEYLLESIAWPGPKLLVTAPGRELPPGEELFDRRAVDQVANQGPLRGVLTALEHSQTVTTVITTVDMPLIRQPHLVWILDQLNTSTELLGAMFRRTIDGIERIEPFPLACRKTAAPLILSHLESGRRSVHSLLQLPQFNAKSVPLDWPADVWTNLNTPEDFQAFAKRLD
jgi:molybdopterin-guanine dinucleotide biosynthesis protein A